MDVHPAVALASVFVGVGLFGAIGALIGIPVAAAILTIVDTFRNRHELMPELAALREESNEPDDDDADGSLVRGDVDLPDAAEPAQARE
jgi:hypothetical protein